MLRGRPRKVRLKKRVKRRLSGKARRGAGTPNQKLAALRRRRTRRGR